MNKKRRMTILSVLVICLSLVLVAGGTYALFSDQVTVNNHLSAGELRVGLERVGYQGCVVGDDGLLVESEKDTQVIDLVQNSDPLFDVVDAVPLSWYEAELRVSNLGDVAFDYGVRVLWNADGTASAEEQELASQIAVTVLAGDEPLAQFTLDASAGKDVAIGSVVVGTDTAQTFTVRAEFLDTDDNNSVMNTDLAFDIQVYAVQKTA